MVAHNVYAQIVDSKVKNIVVCDDYPTAGHLAKCIYGKDAIAVDCSQHRCMIGDLYHDGRFWHIDDDGTETEAEIVPTDSQQIAQLKAENEELTLVIADMIGGVEYAE